MVEAARRLAFILASGERDLLNGELIEGTVS
jgi:hypothetical protein